MKKVLVVLVVLVIIVAGAVLILKPFKASPSQVSSKTAIEFLQKNQNADGGWGVAGTPESDPAITALVLKAMATAGFTDSEAWMQKGIDYLLTFQHDDGSIYKDTYQSYITSLALTALNTIDPERDAYGKVISKAADYLAKIQFRQGDPRLTNPAFEGGITYSSENKPPNLSTTVFALEGLNKAGLPRDSEAFKLAEQFVSRCQNRSESNDGPKNVKLTNDGGFFYGIGDSRGDVQKEADGTMTLRSYGSMTYAGLLSLTYCYIAPDDPRIKSAIEWVQKNYTFDVNPGMPKPMQGIYYYYNTIAKAANAMNLKKLPDGKDLVGDLRKAIISRQLPNGSWINKEEERWLEGNPVLSTAYMVEALALLDAIK